MLVGSKAFGGLDRRLKGKTAESRLFETTGQAPFGRAKAAYGKIQKPSREAASPFSNTLSLPILTRLDCPESKSTCSGRNEPNDGTIHMRLTTFTCAVPPYPS